MTLTDYVIDVLLIAVVFRQLRARDLTRASMVLPLALVGVACLNYLRPFPPTESDVVLIVALTLVGAVLGLASGFATSVWRDASGRVLARAGLLAAVAWVAGMGFRFGFAIWSTGVGAPDIARFSVSHHLSGAHFWTTALVLMAVAEVIARVGLLQLRRVQLRRSSVLPRPYAAVR